MPPKIVKLSKKDDIASVIRQIKNLKDRELVFDLEKGSYLLSTSDNLKLLKRTCEALGKIVKVRTDDELGRVLAKKADVLYGDIEVKMPRYVPRVARSDVKPRFSDILNSKKSLRKVVEQTKETLSYTKVANAFPVVTDNVAKISSSFSKGFVYGLVVLVVAVFGLAVLLPQATVTVFARSEQITRDLEITIDKNVSVANAAVLQVPAIPVTREVSQTKNFPTTGVKLAGTKSAGTVTLYNFTSNILTLKASTTALTANGKNYSFVQDVSGIKPNGIPNTGIQIIAQEAGAGSNLPINTRFEINNAALGNQNVYATSTTAISGGAATSTTVLSQQDLDNAESSLINDILMQAEADLTKEYGDEIKLLSSGVTKEVLAKASNKDVDEAVENFDMTLIAKVTGLAFRSSDVISVVVAKINEVLSSNVYLVDDATRDFSANFKSVDVPNGRGVLAVHFETIAAYKVDESNLSKILSGKNDAEIKEILLSKPEIDNVLVEFWPEWFVHKAPRFNGKVDIKIVLTEQ